MTSLRKRLTSLGNPDANVGPGVPTLDELELHVAFDKLFNRIPMSPQSHGLAPVYKFGFVSSMRFFHQLWKLPNGNRLLYQSIRHEKQ